MKITQDIRDMAAAQTSAQAAGTPEEPVTIQLQ
jgi:hypothetical protein